MRWIVFLGKWPPARVFLKTLHPPPLWNSEPFWLNPNLILAQCFSHVKKQRYIIFFLTNISGELPSLKRWPPARVFLKTLWSLKNSEPCWLNPNLILAQSFSQAKNSGKSFFLSNLSGELPSLGRWPPARVCLVLHSFQRELCPVSDLDNI